MNKNINHITVFEYQAIHFDKDKHLTEAQFKALEKYYGEGVPFYKLVHNGIQFKEFVGVIQVGKTLIEVLPKADKNDTDEDKWRRILIGMLKAVGGFDIKSTSNSNLKIKPNTVLDLYFEMFIKEIEYLLHNGLLKQYRKTEGNVTALKGSLHFSKHILKNLTHQECFYTRHSIYDYEHKFHFILYKAILLLKQINTIASLQSRIGALLLNFPEMPDIKVSEALFNKLVYNRKTLSYKKAIEIAKLLLLQYHPDLSKGRNDVLALMFDMNKLWEQFIFMSLRKNNAFSITGQTSKYFWEPERGDRSKIRPDIVINKDSENCVVLDTKWKNLGGINPSPEDLRQMYVYHEYYGAKKVALIYPGNSYESKKGWYYPSKNYNKKDKECSVITLDIPKEKTENKSIIKSWQIQIGEKVKELLA